VAFGVAHVALGRDHRVRPAVEVIVVLVSNADHGGDEAQRKRHGDLGYEVADAPRRDLVDGVGGDLAEHVLELLHHSRGEATVDQVAKVRVPRLGLVDQSDLGRIVGTHPFRRGEDVLVLGNVCNVLVAADDEYAVRLAPVHRVVLAQPSRALVHRLFVPALGGEVGNVELHGELLLYGFRVVRNGYSAALSSRRREVPVPFRRAARSVAQWRRRYSGRCR